jgi:Rrf2 family protein
MRISKVTSHAVRILLDCAAIAPEPVRAAEIAERQRITEYNVQKIVAQLAQHGFLKTTRGRNGGIGLGMSPEAINLGQLVRVTELSHVEADCFGDHVDCALLQMTPINRILDEAYREFVGVLDRYSLADLIRGRPAIGDFAAQAGLGQSA